MRKRYVIYINILVFIYIKCLTCQITNNNLTIDVIKICITIHYIYVYILIKWHGSSKHSFIGAGCTENTFN